MGVTCRAAHALTSASVLSRASQARTNGHQTSSLTSWGHDASWDRQQVHGQNDRPTQRAHVPAPSTRAIESTLRGEALPGEAAEPHILANGHAVTPRTTPSAAAVGATPWATDDDPPAPSKEPPPLFDSISGVVRCGGGARVSVASQQPSASLTPGSLIPSASAANPEDDPAYRESGLSHLSHRHTPRDHLLGASRIAESGAETDGAAAHGAAAHGAAASCAPLPPPPVVTEPPAPMVLDALQSLSNALADRGVTWESAFALYDPTRSGVVSAANVLRVFRGAGISPAASLLDSLPAATTVAGGGVRYMVRGHGSRHSEAHLRSPDPGPEALALALTLTVALILTVILAVFQVLSSLVSMTPPPIALQSGTNGVLHSARRAPLSSSGPPPPPPSHGIPTPSHAMPPSAPATPATAAQLPAAAADGLSLHSLSLGPTPGVRPPALPL